MDLSEKIKQYLHRIEGREVENYSLDEIGYWRIMSGDVELGRYPIRDVLHGRFIDAVAYIVQHPEYYGEFVDNNDIGNRSNGKIEKINLVELESKVLSVSV